MKTSIRRLTAAALLLSLPLVQAGGFLGDLKKVVPKSAAALTERVPDVGKNHDDLAKAVSQEVAKAIPTDVADKIVASKDSISSITEGAMKGSVKDAAGSLKDSAEQTVHDTLQTAESSGVVSDMGEAVEKVPQALDVLQSATPDSVASTLREATPEVASVVNRTSLHAADIVRKQSPKLAAELNKAGHRMADRLDGGNKGATEKPSWLPSIGDFPDSAEVRKASDWGLALVVVGVLTVAGGFTAFQRHKSPERAGFEPGPALLSEMQGTSSSSTSSRRPARQPIIQTEAQTSLFQKF